MLEPDTCVEVAQVWIKLSYGPCPIPWLIPPNYGTSIYQPDSVVFGEGRCRNVHQCLLCLSYDDDNDDDVICCYYYVIVLLLSEHDLNPSVIT